MTRSTFQQPNAEPDGAKTAPAVDFAHAIVASGLVTSAVGVGRKRRHPVVIVG